MLASKRPLRCGRRWGSPPAAAPRSQTAEGYTPRDVRAVPIKVLTVSRDNSKGANLMAGEWLEKIARHTAVSSTSVKPNPVKSASPEVQKQAEAQRVRMRGSRRPPPEAPPSTAPAWLRCLECQCRRPSFSWRVCAPSLHQSSLPPPSLQVLKCLAPTEHVVLLDERGREVTSYDVADIIARAGDDCTPLVFIIGGPYGHGDAVRQRANDTIRLSRLVLNHQVAHVVLLEAIFRGWSILRGDPYHHV